MHILVPSAHVFFFMANFKGTHTPMHVLKKWREDSELISNIDLPEFRNYVSEGRADMTL